MPEGPAPAGSHQEGVRCQRRSKCRADEGSRREGESPGTVAQTGGIDNEDLQDQINAVVTDPVQGVAGHIGIGSVAGGQNNHSNHVDEQRDEQTLGSTPQVQGFGQRQSQHTGHHVGGDVGGGDLGRGLEVGKGIGGEVTQHGLMEGQHEIADPDPAFS